MIKFFRRIMTLCKKELKSFLNDKVLLIFVIFAFTGNIVTAAKGVSMELTDASIAIVDEDNSKLSRDIIDSFHYPEFKNPKIIQAKDIDNVLDKGLYTFALHIPKDFQELILNGNETEIQLNVDATRMSQSYIGASYITKIISNKIQLFLHKRHVETTYPIEQVVGVKYNPNMESYRFMAIVELLIMVTLLSMILPAVALVREREKGTIEHLLVMPVTPNEIMISKILANALIVLFGFLLCNVVVIRIMFDIDILGNFALLVFGLFVFQFTVASLGIMLATFSANVPQLSMLVVLCMMPMVFLSGGFTPTEAMNEFVQMLMYLAPLKYFMDFATSIIFRGGEFYDLIGTLLIMFFLGVGTFYIATLRFRTWFLNKI